VNEFLQADFFLAQAAFAVGPMAHGPQIEILSERLGSASRYAEHAGGHIVWHASNQLLHTDRVAAKPDDVKIVTGAASPIACLSKPAGGPFRVPSAGLGPS
jgi:hypothetical protein